MSKKTRTLEQELKEIKTLRQKLIRIIEHNHYNRFGRDDIVEQFVDDIIENVVEEWLQKNVKDIFYKNLMPDLSGKTQRKIEKSIKELLEELKKKEKQKHE